MYHEVATMYNSRPFSLLLRAYNGAPSIALENSLSLRLSLRFGFRLDALPKEFTLWLCFDAYIKEITNGVGVIKVTFHTCFQNGVSDK